MDVRTQRSEGRTDPWIHAVTDPKAETVEEEDGSPMHAPKPALHRSSRPRCHGTDPRVIALFASLRALARG
ncbi:hypothetical protein MesoLjLc_75230 [Mesorhizobium sp. L-8-10]|nr:hypothetical protein MesoLjLc_75230 [Mesorhizobium sp. L-8-10]